MIETIDATVGTEEAISNHRNRTHHTEYNRLNLLWASLVVCLAIGIANLRYGLTYEKTFLCNKEEICAPECISTDTSALVTNLEKFSDKSGIKVNDISKAFQTFFLNIHDSNGPLCLGLTGDISTVNEIINIIVNTLYRNGKNSHFVHRYKKVPGSISIPTLFKVEVEKCSRSIFILEFLNNEEIRDFQNFENEFINSLTSQLFRESVFLLVGDIRWTLNNTEMRWNIQIFNVD